MFLTITALIAAQLGATAPDAPPDPRDFVCAPRMQLRSPYMCPRHGPGAAATELAVMGLLSPKPLPVAAIDPSLYYIPFDYVRVNSGKAEVYSSADDAANGGGGTSWIGGGFVYLSYFERQERSGEAVYATPSGYVNGSDVSRIELPDSFGLQFERTPDRPFGWIISGGTCTSPEPGAAARGGRCFTRHSLVQIYDMERVGEWDWYMIAPDQWIEQRLLSVVHPDPVRPAGVEGDRWISVNLYEQTLSAYEDGELVFAAPASTGRNGFWTQPGTFQVWAKLERDTMTGGLPDVNYYYLQDVPWVLYFDEARALHGTYWHSRFGTPTSRGCVNLAPVDANWVFQFAEEGTYVHVYDPSGNTPTDPALYGPGGA